MGVLKKLENNNYWFELTLISKLFLLLSNVPYWPNLQLCTIFFGHNSLKIFSPTNTFDLSAHSSNFDDDVTSSVTFWTSFQMHEKQYFREEME